MAKQLESSRDGAENCLISKQHPFVDVYEEEEAEYNGCELSPLICDGLWRWYHCFPIVLTKEYIPLLL